MDTVKSDSDKQDITEMDAMKSDSDKLDTGDNDQHMASDGEGTNSKPAENDKQQEQSAEPVVKSEPPIQMENCMGYGPKKRRINSPCSIFENRELIQKAMTKLAKEEDECGIFGRYVASVMRSLSSEPLKRKLKKRIQQILLEMADEEDKLKMADEDDIIPNPTSTSIANTGYSPSI